MEKFYDVIILGSGPAGWTAAIYLSRGGFKPLVLTGNQPGGQLMLTTDIENYPGFESISGGELMSRMQKQAKRFATEVITDEAVKVEEVDKGFRIVGRQGEYSGRAVVIATGASALWLDIPGVDKLRGKGVSVCATCDGPFFKDKTIAIVGGGDTALTEAEFLTRFAKKVYLIHRREEYRAEKLLQDRIAGNKKIVPVLDSQVKEFLGENKLEGLKIETKGKESQLDVDGCFLAIGHKPNTDFLKGFIELGEKGYIKTQNEVFASVKGVFAAGDCVDWQYRQAITAAGMGCKAATEAGEWLKTR